MVNLHAQNQIFLAEYSPVFQSADTANSNVPHHHLIIAGSVISLMMTVLITLRSGDDDRVNHVNTTSSQSLASFKLLNIFRQDETATFQGRSVVLK